jgi:uncharacterized membrane protein
MSEAGEAARVAHRWPLVALIGGALAVLVSYVPPSWYGQRVVGSNIGAGALWLMGLVAMVIGTVAVVRSFARVGGAARRRRSVAICVACWGVAVVTFVIGIVSSRA